MTSPCSMGFLLSLLTITVCASLLRAPEVLEAARVPEADEKPCVRDVDCFFTHPHCKGLLVCNHGKCDCLGASAGRPISPALPPSQCPGLKICNNDGKCFCTGGGPNSPVERGPTL